MKKKIIIISAIIVGLFLAGGLGYYIYLKMKQSTGSLTIVPFKENSDDRWGLIDITTGEIIVKNEWENKPTPAVNGIVRVENKDGQYEFYTAEEKPKQVGDKYKFAGEFFEGIAPVSKENSCIVFINTKGEDVFTLKDADGKSVEKVSNMCNGYASFMTSDEKWGFVDDKGEVVIKPIYDEVGSFSEGIAIVAKNDYDKDSNRIRKYGFIDEKGKEVISLKKDMKYMPLCTEGLIAFCDNDENEWGFINKEGEKVIKPSSDLKLALPFINGYAMISDGENVGLINNKGEKVIRPKYKTAFYTKDLVLIEDKDKFGFVNLEGTEVLKTDYDEALPFMSENTIVKDGSKYIIVDKKGKQVGKNDFEECGVDIQDALKYILRGFANYYIESDYFDASGAAGAIIKSVSANEFNGISANSSPDNVCKALNAKVEEIGGIGNYISLMKELNKTVYSSTYVYFDQEARVPVMESGVDDWGYESQRFSGNYTLNNTGKATHVGISIRLQGKGAGKAEAVAKLLKDKMAKSGMSIDESISTKNTFAYKNSLGKIGACISITGESSIDVLFGFINAIDVPGLSNYLSSYEMDAILDTSALSEPVEVEEYGD